MGCNRGSRLSLVFNSLQIDAVLRDAQIFALCRTDQRCAGLYVPSLHPQGGANAEIRHCADAKCADDSRSLSKLRLLSAGTCFPKVVLKHIFGHPDTVIHHAQLSVLNRYFDSALSDRKVLRCATHKYCVICVLHVLAQEGLRRVVDLGRQYLQNSTGLDIECNPLFRASAHFFIFAKNFFRCSMSEGSVDVATSGIFKRLCKLVRSPSSHSASIRKIASVELTGGLKLAIILDRSPSCQRQSSNSRRANWSVGA